MSKTPKCSDVAVFLSGRVTVAVFDTSATMCGENGNSASPPTANLWNNDYKATIEGKHIDINIFDVAEQSYLTATDDYTGSHCSPRSPKNFDAQ
jgi:hypothetical protein